MVSGPVFISYARRDYYFAESLAFHLQRYQVPVWLDAKDLEPGADWQQQLESALDSASCVLVVVSADSATRPAVRMEWERARNSGKRIIVVRFRRARLPVELAPCELVDFRSGFAGPLRTLIQMLAGADDVRPQRSWLPMPPWILAITLTLLLPLLCYFSLANWKSTARDVVLWFALPLFIFGFFWFFCLSFLRRKMGMTRLAGSFAFPAVWSIYPLVRYWLAGPAHIADTWLAAIARNPLPMEIAAASTVAGVAIVFLVRPDDLLRWTPTGKAWSFYREGCLAKLSGVDRPSALRKVTRYCLLHDAPDGPAAKRLRNELSALGATEDINPSADQTTILLLTSRTRLLWLTNEAEKLRSEVLTVVGSRIGLPAQLEWLWKREWIDFRHWDLQRLDRKRGLLQVPEAVTGIRYPVVVRVVHHYLCVLTALAFSLLPLADPAAFGNHAEETPSRDLEAIIVFAICACCGILAQRLLNRTVSQPGFEKAWKIGYVSACVFSLWAFPQALRHGVDWWKLIPFAAYLIAFPFLLSAKRDQIGFWFPTPGASRPGVVARLKTGRQWQTFLWVWVYLGFFGYFAGLYNN